MVYYFAYGSNIDLKRVEGMDLHFSSIRAATLHDWKLVFNVIDNKYEGTGYANIVPSKHRSVEGLIYEIDRSSIKKLDFLEGYPHYYLKKKITVVNNDDGAKINCLTYVGNQEMIEKGLKPLRIYMKHLLSGKIFMSNEYFRNLNHIKTIEGDRHHKLSTEKR